MNKLGPSEAAMFRPIPETVVYAIRNDSTCLESSFWLNGNRSEEIQVMMTNKYIALGERRSFQIVCRYYAELTFDLKF
jgi:hypothetical protein